MKYKEDFNETQKHFNAWWDRSSLGRPLMKVVANRKEPAENLETGCDPLTPEELHLDVDKIVGRFRNYCRTHKFLADSFPALDINIGPGSMALYLGSEPNLRWDTVWFKEVIGDWESFGPLKFDEENYWWRKHINMAKRARELSHEDFIVTIPDIIENVDILSAMRGPQEFCYDLIDYPELMKKYVEQVDDLYFKYYDTFYDIVKLQDGSSSFTAFNIWGPGKTAKIQCDFCALMSPRQFREFAQESLRKQCQKLSHSLYHLDGPDAIKHVDALMEIKELDAIQWTAGAGQPDGGSEKWYPLYDKIRKADKSLWIAIYDGDYEDWAERAEKLVKRYGADGLYLLFPDMEEEEALKLIDKAEKSWK